jgi:transcriptional regulator with XRE-family HTH domain
LKFVSRPIDAPPEHSVFLTTRMESLLLLLFAHTSKMSTNPMMRSRQLKIAQSRSVTELPRQYLSKSMEKTFLRMKRSPAARHAYLEAELTTGLAHQIRAIRNQRGWSQGALAKRLGTTQAAVSRLEDPSYGRYSLSTLIDLAKVFDVGMQVRFTSFITMLQETFRPNAANRKVTSFIEECHSVDFFTTTPVHAFSSYVPIASADHSSGTRYLNIQLSGLRESAIIELPLKKTHLLQ